MEKPVVAGKNEAVERVHRGRTGLQIGSFWFEPPLRICISTPPRYTESESMFKVLGKEALMKWALFAVN